ncbi:hypothetical protein VNO77_37657 [Canavalia gladiata]|uniref:TIR domain-containing protein n=1 Tax=Canavalia gladiata TaxID=3824 RepID=A0AAN9PUW2_CANGL
MINDVFISFCGKDTGGSFASALYTTLTDAGVFVYRHDDSIVRKDEQISVSVLKAIEASRISIIVFSTNYADSSWCLQEMEKIMECRKTKGQKIVPVFYGVNPFDVRNQRGMFGKAFENLMRRMLGEEDKVSSWRDAFDEACKISGFTVMDIGNERAKVKNIVESVIFLLDRTKLFIPKHPVGVESRAQYVIELLDSEKAKNVFGHFAEIGISALVERSLVTVDGHNKLGMLDLLRDMGREIIRQKSPYEPAKRSRLWFHKDVLEILSKYKETNYLEGLSLKLPKGNTSYFDTRVFEKMEKLRLLKFDNVQFDGNFEYLPRNLTWLCWHGFPLKYIPAKFLAEGLAVIELKSSNLTQLWKKGQMMEKLKVLNLSHSQHLTTTPDFSYMPNLEKLVLKDCQKLVEVSHTIGCLTKLRLVNLRDCRGLRKLPRSIYTLEYLKTLIIAGCSKIEELEEDLVQMKSLSTLIANDTAITKVPFSILKLKDLEYISISDYEGYSHDVIPSVNWALKKEVVLSWKRAFREAAGISGIVLLNSRNENEDIKKIVEHVTHLLDRTELFVVDHPVGVESRVQDAIKLLNSQHSKDVLLLGICGMGGIGKTTIAKAIFNQIGGNFEGKSFLLNIREVWEQYTNRVSLQQVLDDICKESTMKIHNIESGKNILKERFTHKRVLLVLDDVDELDQLNAFCGSSKWFGPGSKIIITTRDRHLLTMSNVDLEYEIGEMDEIESLEHFCWHAFKQDGPKEDFAESSKSIVDYCKGLPLALEVLGSYLFGRGMSEWDSVLKRLNVNGKVQQKLRISFDGLNHAEKEIFLDISCFFIGMDRNYVIQILNGCGFSAEIGIGVLVERSLVTIDNKNKLQMHDLLRDMGREIIREKSPHKPEKHSRLWNPKEVLDVLSKEKGTKATEGLTLKLENTTCLKTKAFKKMYNLRLLQLAGVQLDGDFKHFSRDLRWLCWNGFPLTCTPTEFHQESLVVIELKYSNLKQIWTKGQEMLPEC